MLSTTLSTIQKLPKDQLPKNGLKKSDVVGRETKFILHPLLKFREQKSPLHAPAYHRYVLFIYTLHVF
jgi:hypothetical protein